MWSIYFHVKSLLIRASTVVQAAYFVVPGVTGFLGVCSSW